MRKTSAGLASHIWNENYDEGCIPPPLKHSPESRPARGPLTGDAGGQIGGVIAPTVRYIVTNGVPLKPPLGIAGVRAGAVPRGRLWQSLFREDFRTRIHAG
jgi:hypothetical protein